ncbi:MAG TPA: hypothetical protein VGM53_25735 [Streptosporangiaceae bacterium]
MTVGAGVGISGYRRANRVVREISRSPLRPRWRVSGMAAFARDVRDGMDLYAEQQRLNIERRRAPAAPALGSLPVTEAPRLTGPPASRNGSSAPSAHR